MYDPACPYPPPFAHADPEDRFQFSEVACELELISRKNEMIDNEDEDEEEEEEEESDDNLTDGVTIRCIVECDQQSQYHAGRDVLQLNLNFLSGVLI